ncbi:MAG: hypothetical protein IPL89_16115 [Acidobacteria bacterium]|nr:hypothetical protein [Acidobacteriota bacterium]
MALELEDVQRLRGGVGGRLDPAGEDVEAAEPGEELAGREEAQEIAAGEVVHEDLPDAAERRRTQPGDSSGEGRDWERVAGLLHRRRCWGAVAVDGQGIDEAHAHVRGAVSELCS